MIKITICGENSEVSWLEDLLSSYYFCDKTGKIKLDGIEESVKIHLKLEEKEAVSLINQGGEIEKKR